MLHKQSSIRRRWFRFSLRTFLIAVAVVCIVLGMYVKQRRDQQAAIAVVRRWGGTIYFRTQFDQSISQLNAAAGFPITGPMLMQQTPMPSPLPSASMTGRSSSRVQTFTFAPPVPPAAPPPIVPPATSWTKRLLGDFFFDDVAAVHLNGYATMHLDGRQIARMPRLRWLSLRGTSVRDDNLRQLESLKSLEWLDLGLTQVTDDGLPHLQRLPALKHLILQGTQVTDDGLKALSEIRTLESLWLHETRITVAGRQRLQSALPNCTVN